MRNPPQSNPLFHLFHLKMSDDPSKLRSSLINNSKDDISNNYKITYLNNSSINNSKDDIPNKILS